MSPLCPDCNDEARHLFCQEVREGLRVRGLWAPIRESDLLCAIFQAIDGTPETKWRNAAFMDLVVQMAEKEIQERGQRPWAVSGMPVYWKVPVIKAYRAQTGLGLKESKEAIDAWQETEAGKKVIARLLAVEAVIAEANHEYVEMVMEDHKDDKS